MRSAIVLLVLACAAPASAQTSLRDEARAALRAGEFENALRLFRTAAADASDPTVWLEVGDAADRLRDDAVALDAYERYLAARPDAPDRAEILARIAVLQRIVTRHRAGPLGPDDFIPAEAILDALEEAPRGLGRRLHRP